MANEIVRVFDGHDIRIVEKNGEFFWVASDVCAVLGVSNTSKALERLDVDEKSEITLSDISSNGVVQDRSCLALNQYGLFSLVLSSRKPIAKPFKRWVTHEVLPSIAKTGSYSIAEETPKPRSSTDPNLVGNTIAISTMLTDLMVDGGILELATAKKFVLNQVALKHPELSEEIKALNAAAPIEVKELHFTPTQLGEKMNPARSGRQVNQLLTAAGFQSDRAKDEPHYTPTEKGKQFAWMEIDQASHKSGKTKTFQQLKWSIDVLDFLPGLISRSIGGVE